MGLTPTLTGNINGLQISICNPFWRLLAIDNGLDPAVDGSNSEEVYKAPS